MPLPRRALFLVYVLMWSGCAVMSVGAPGSPQVNARAAAIKDFDDRVKAFRELHKKLEAELDDPVQASKDAAKLQAGEKRLTIAVQQARRDARQGDFFTPAVTPIFREIVTAYFEGENPKLATSPQDRPPPMAVKLNAKYPQAAPVPTMPPTLLASLPRLPEDLAYRFVERTLILMDVDTDLILDYLPHASRRVK